MKDKVHTILQTAIDDLTLLLKEETKKIEAEEAREQYKAQIKTILQEYFDLRKNLLINKILELSNRDHMQESLGKRAYLEEYGTLRLDFGRQTGNSYFIKEIDKKMSSVQKKPFICVVFIKQSMKDYHQLKNAASFTKYQIFNTPVSLSDYQTVIVDNSSCIPAFELKKIYDLCSFPDSKTELIILT